MTDHFTETTFLLAGFVGGIALSFFAFVLAVWLLARLDEKSRR